MPQMHFYVPEAVAEQLRARARALGLPISRYLAVVAGRDVHTGWLPAYFDEVVGGWQGEPLRRQSQGRLEDREGK